MLERRRVNGGEKGPPPEHRKTRSSLTQPGTQPLCHTQRVGQTLLLVLRTEVGTFGKLAFRKMSCFLSVSNAIKERSAELARFGMGLRQLHRLGIGGGAGRRFQKHGSFHAKIKPHPRRGTPRLMKFDPRTSSSDASSSSPHLILKRSYRQGL
jgi:hypothetical protein